MPSLLPHQYIDRHTGRVCTERLFNDALVRCLYSAAREYAPAFFRLATSRHTTALLGLLNYDLPFGGSLAGHRAFLAESGIDLSECISASGSMLTCSPINNAATCRAVSRTASANRWSRPRWPCVRR
jgi:hypothetical protein